MAEVAHHGDIDQQLLRAVPKGMKLNWFDSFAAPRPSLGERLAQGKSLRQQVPRSSHAQYRARPSSADPLALLEHQNASRIPDLVPIRMARMLASPFSFLRGAAAVMASDLARTPATGLSVMAAGDMHLMNFGLFASAERNLVFAINDFDEVHPGPWEWDLKRLAASCAVAAIFAGGDRDDAADAAWHAVQSYVLRMRRYAESGYLATWYDVINEEEILEGTPPSQRKVAADMMDRARARGQVRTLDKLTQQVAGEHRIIEAAPLIVRETHLANGKPVAEGLDEMLSSYLASLPEDRRRLLRRYRIIDVARKVVGVGSVGLACWVVLFQGLDSSDPLFLQIKQAQTSVLAPYVKIKLPHKNQGQRVVLGQRMIQGSPDIFLGWGPAEDAAQDLPNFYVRQLADMKGGIALSENDNKTLAILPDYARLCGWAAALAHAKSGDPGVISGYCGLSDALPNALAEFALAYLEQNDRDHAALAHAVRHGRIRVASPREAGLR